jgi:hypothetical protein
MFSSVSSFLPTLSAATSALSAFGASAASDPIRAPSRLDRDTEDQIQSDGEDDVDNRKAVVEGGKGKAEGVNVGGAGGGGAAGEEFFDSLTHVDVSEVGVGGEGSPGGSGATSPGGSSMGGFGSSEGEDDENSGSGIRKGINKRRDQTRKEVGDEKDWNKVVERLPSLSEFELGDGVVKIGRRNGQLPKPQQPQSQSQHGGHQHAKGLMRRTSLRSGLGGSSGGVGWTRWDSGFGGGGVSGATSSSSLSNVMGEVGSSWTNATNSNTKDRRESTSLNSPSVTSPSSVLASYSSTSASLKGMPSGK